MIDSIGNHRVQHDASEALQQRLAVEEILCEGSQNVQAVPPAAQPKLVWLLSLYGYVELAQQLLREQFQLTTTTRAASLGRFW